LPEEKSSAPSAPKNCTKFTAQPASPEIMEKGAAKGGKGASRPQPQDSGSGAGVGEALGP
jgi:hypothetical protein